MKAVIPEQVSKPDSFLQQKHSNEMLPVYNKPTIQYVIEEAIASGIDDILIIINKTKDQ